MDIMKEYIRQLILESYENENISLEEASMLMECVDEYVVEKKSREKYRVDKFKKEYNFIPDYTKDKFGNIGTILVDGKRIDVDMDIHSKTANIEQDGMTIPVQRQISAKTSTVPEGIILDKNVFNLKNKNRMKALLNHEIGHLKMHSTQPDSKMRDPKFVSPANINALVDQQIGQFAAFLGDMTPADKRELKLELMGQIDSKGYLKTGDMNKDVRRIRDLCWKTAQKYAKKDIYHANPQEFEADRYAANKSGSKHLKRALRDYVRRSMKVYNKQDNKNVNKTMRKEIHRGIAQLNTMHSGDYNARARALKDKDLQNASIYK